MDQERRVEYKNNRNNKNNLNSEKDLIVLDQISTVTNLSKVVDNTSYYNLDNRDMLRKVTVKIELERTHINN